jgi:hypothetical protein
MDNIEAPSTLASWLGYKAARWREDHEIEAFLLPEEAQREFGAWWPALPEAMQRALRRR